MHYLGKNLVQKCPESPDIPFLFKVLSINKALPLQAHPDVQLAKELNKQDKKEFVDVNHKPEIAIAIGDPLPPGPWEEDATFAGFVGFKSLAEIQQSLRTISELRSAIGNEGSVEDFVTNPTKESLKKVFGALLIGAADDPENVKKQISALLLKIQARPGEPLVERAVLKETAELVEKINSQFPGDVGVFAAPFFMNFVKLRKGEAIYIDADEIHAYLEGGQWNTRYSVDYDLSLILTFLVDIMECMATSDNVLNAAFAPRAETKRHIPTFVEMLTYNFGNAAQWSLPYQFYPHSTTQATRMYKPPFEEFVVLRTFLQSSRNEELLRAAQGPLIGIVTQGTCKVRPRDGPGEEITLNKGGVVFVVPGTDVQVELVEEERCGDDVGSEIWWATHLG